MFAFFGSLLPTKTQKNGTNAGAQPETFELSLAYRQREFENCEQSETCLFQVMGN